MLIAYRRVTSTFFGHAYSETVQAELYNCCETLGLGGLLQVSMDGPNANLNAHRLLDVQISGEVGHRLFNIGSCGLHTVHNVFRTGYASTDWKVEEAFTSFYWLFKNSPARREDFTSVTGSDLFPKRFCQTRWVENVPIAQRLLKMWPHVQKYLAACKEGRLPSPNKNK